MARTTATEVRSVLETSEEVNAGSIERFIKTANALTNYIVGKDTLGLLTVELQLEVETYLAAHFYALKDAQVQSKSTGGASDTYQGQTGMRLDLTWWGQQAMVLDVTGLLAILNKPEGQGLIGIHWLGQTTQERTPWDIRNSEGI